MIDARGIGDAFARRSPGNVFDRDLRRSSGTRYLAASSASFWLWLPNARLLAASIASFWLWLHDASNLAASIASFWLWLPSASNLAASSAAFYMSGL
jgi:hypothetical protein